jgi:hypothetical protein
MKKTQTKLALIEAHICLTALDDDVRRFLLDLVREFQRVCQEQKGGCDCQRWDALLAKMEEE